MMSSSASTVLLVAHADRGHFNWCIPLAQNLKKLGLSVELWTNGLCAQWLPANTMDKIESSEFGSGEKLHACVGLYKATVSEGETDPQGRSILFRDGMKRAIENLALVNVSLEEFRTIATGGVSGQDAFKARVKEPDVAFVAWEGVWGKHAARAADEAGKPHMGFMPSYLRPYRAAYSKEPVLEFDGQEKLRDTHEDINEWPKGHDVAFMISQCLQGKAKNMAGLTRFGFFLPPRAEAAEGLDQELESWMGKVGKITVISLGSQSTLKTLPLWAERDLLKGCLAASPRVLIASADVREDPELKKAVANGRLRVSAWIPLFTVLGHENVGCLVSHCGANSVHEALAQGKAIAPFPFFDDQFYIASLLEDLLGYSEQSGFVPLRKSALRSAAGAGVPAVEAAVRRALEVPAQTLQMLKQSIWRENGALKAAMAVKARIKDAPKLLRPEFTKLASVQPDSKGVNLMLKVVKVGEIPSENGKILDVVVCDASAIGILRVTSPDHAKLCKPGASLRLQNARVLMAKGSMRVTIDKWGVLKAADAPLEFPIKMDIDI